MYDFALAHEWTAGAAPAESACQAGVKEPGLPAQVPGPNPTPDAGPPMVLVVDDEAQLRKIIETWVKRQGVPVATAASVAEAARQMREHRHEIALALVDYSLGPETGFQAIEALTALKPDLNIILMSGMAIDHPQTAGHPKIIEVLAKPFRMADLLATIRNTLASLTAPGS